MIVIYINSGGTAQVVSPSHIYQGSNQSSVTVFANVPTTTAMSIAFKLPDGTSTPYYPMTPIQNSDGLSQYEFTLNASLTQKAGQSVIALMAVFSDGRQTSQLIALEIEPSVLPEPPKSIDESAYEIILKYLQQDRSDIMALQGQINDIEETADNAEKASQNAVDTANEAKETADGLADSIAQANTTAQQAVNKATAVEGQQKKLEEDYAFWKENVSNDQEAFKDYVKLQNQMFQDEINQSVGEDLDGFRSDLAKFGREITQFETNVNEQVGEVTNTANEAKETADGLSASIAQANNTANEAKSTADGLADSIAQANTTAQQSVATATEAKEIAEEALEQSKGSGTKVNIAGEFASEIDFTSDPQTQLNELQSEKISSVNLRLSTVDPATLVLEADGKQVARATVDDTTKLPVAGGIITGAEITIVKGLPYSDGVQLPAHRLAIGKNGIAITNGGTKDDAGWIRMLGTTESDTVLEIAVGDDGGTGESIVARQYDGSNNVKRQLTLLEKSDEAGNYNPLKIDPSKFEPTTANGWTVGSSNLQLPDIGIYLVNINSLGPFILIHPTNAGSFISSFVFGHTALGGYTGMYIKALPTSNPVWQIYDIYRQTYTTIDTVAYKKIA